MKRCFNGGDEFPPFFSFYFSQVYLGDLVGFDLTQPLNHDISDKMEYIHRNRHST